MCLVTRDGVREVLGLWIADNEGANFWRSVMNQLRNRGLQDIVIAVIDGLKGFPEAIYLSIRNFEKGGRNVREWFAARTQLAIMFDTRSNA